MSLVKNVVSVVAIVALSTASYYTGRYIGRKLRKTLDDRCQETADAAATEATVDVMYDLTKDAMDRLCRQLKADGIVVSDPWSSTDHPFQDSWNNGTGYYNGAVTHKFEGEVPQVLVRFNKDSRRFLIIVPNEKGDNHVIFQRYSNAVRWQEMRGNTELSVMDLDGLVDSIKANLPK